VTAILRFLTASSRFKPLYICVTKRGAGSDNVRVCVHVDVCVRACNTHKTAKLFNRLKVKALIS